MTTGTGQRTKKSRTPPEVVGSTGFEEMLALPSEETGSGDPAPEVEVAILLGKPTPVPDEPLPEMAALVAATPREPPKFVVGVERNPPAWDDPIWLVLPPEEPGSIYQPLSVEDLRDPEYRAAARRHYDFPDDRTLQVQFGIDLGLSPIEEIDFKAMLAEVLEGK